MEPPAIAQGFRTKFHLHGNHNPFTLRRQKHPNGTQSNESTSLLHNLTHNDAGAPLIADSRRWVRWPSNTLYLTYKTLGSNYVNVFLVFVPLGIISGICKWNQTAVFILNFLAIIPLASLLSFATEELSVKLGQTLGGLLNATFGNAVELIVSVVALLDGEIRIVQSSMLGSILSNILLVLGCCFLVGGLKYDEQRFNSTMASTMSSLMAVSSASLIIPATLYAAMESSPKDKTGSYKDLKKPSRQTKDNILVLSHGTAIILLVLYVLYLNFQLRTHSFLFDPPRRPEDEEGHSSPEDGGERLEQHDVEEEHSTLEDRREGLEQHGEEEEHSSPEDRRGGLEQHGKEEVTLSPWAAATALVVITIVVAICAEYLVGSINSIVETAHISKTFIGLILLPIVGNAAEHVTAVVVAYKNKMDLAIGVAIGSSMQIALLVTPFLVILGWIIGQDMTLHFKSFETVVFFLSVLITNYLISDGKSNYLEGAMLLGLYAIIAIAFFVYPDDAGG